MNYSYIRKLSLNNYRNHINFSHDFTQKVIIAGANGVGKTNILEAISLLSPGRGLRDAKISEIITNNINNNWSVYAELIIDELEYQLGTGFNINNEERRIIKINGKFSKSQSAFTKIIAIFWLTPQMDQILSGPAANRRKFFDKVTNDFFPEFNDYLNNYENSIRERMKLLKQNYNDDLWLKVIEENIAEYSVILIEFRKRMIEILNQATNQNQTNFPKFRLEFASLLEKNFGKIPSIQTEEEIKKQLKINREIDRITGRTNFGPHKMDIEIFLTHKEIPISKCSTGEQKALLVSIFISKIYGYIKKFGKSPIILLDEIASHFDYNKLSYLFEYLNNFEVQYFVTCVDDKIFRTFLPNAQYIQLENRKNIS